MIETGVQDLLRPTPRSHLISLPSLCIGQLSQEQARIKAWGKVSSFDGSCDNFILQGGIHTEMEIIVVIFQIFFHMMEL